MPTPYELNRDGHFARKPRQDRRVGAGVAGKGFGFDGCISGKGRVEPAGAGHSGPTNRKLAVRQKLVIHRPPEQLI